MTENEIEIYSSIVKIIQPFDVVYANKTCILMKTNTSVNSFKIIKGELPKKGVLRYEETPRVIKLFEHVLYYPTAYFNYSLNKKDNPITCGADVITICKNSDVKFVDLYNLLDKDLSKYTFKIV